MTSLAAVYGFVANSTPNGIESTPLNDAKILAFLTVNKSVAAHLFSPTIPITLRHVRGQLTNRGQKLQ
jgi:hypothetical protein